MAVTGDSWPDASAQAISVTNDAAPLYFILLLVFGDMIVMNLFIAVLLGGFDDAEGGPMELEENVEAARQYLHKKPTEALRALAKEKKKADESQRKVCEDMMGAQLFRQTTLSSGSPKALRGLSNMSSRAIKDTIQGLTLAVVNSSIFLNAIFLVVVLDCVVIAVRVSESKSDKLLETFSALFMTVYIIEAALKIYAFSPKMYFTRWECIVDFSLIVVGLFFFGFPESPAVRCLYSLRPLRVLTRTDATRLILESSFAVFPEISSAILMIFIFLFSFSVFFVAIFKGALHACNDDTISTEDNCIGSFMSDGELVSRKWQNIHFARNFDNVPSALVTLFQVSTLTSWNEVMYSCIDSVGVGKAPERNHEPVWGVVFFIFVMLGAFIAFNIFVALLVSKFYDQHRMRDGSLFLTPQQKGWLNSQKYILDLMELPLKNYDLPENPIRRVCYQIAGSPSDVSKFDYFISVMIILNAFFLCLDWHEAPQSVEDASTVTNYIFTVVFTLELIIKSTAWGVKVYFRDPWNQFDALIVVMSIIGLGVEDLGSVALVFRTLRVLRVFMLIRKLPILSQFSQVFVLSLPAIANALLVVFIIMFIYALMGTILFKKVAFWEEGLNSHANFRDFPSSMLGMFRIAVGDAWEEFMYGAMITEETGACSNAEGTCGHWSAALFFISYVVLVQVMLIGLSLAVMMESFSQYLERDKLYETLCVWRDEWSKRDPKAYGFLPASKLMDVIRKAPSPLGFGGRKLTARQTLTALKGLNIMLRKEKVSMRRLEKIHRGEVPRRLKFKKEERQEEQENKERERDQASPMSTKHSASVRKAIKTAIGKGIKGQNTDVATEWVCRYDDLMRRLVDMYYSVDEVEVEENIALQRAIASSRKLINRKRTKGKIDLTLWYCVQLIGIKWYNFMKKQGRLREQNRLLLDKRGSQIGRVNTTPGKNPGGHVFPDFRRGKSAEAKVTKLLTPREKKGKRWSMSGSAMGGIGDNKNSMSNQSECSYDIHAEENIGSSKATRSASKGHTKPVGARSSQALLVAINEDTEGKVEKNPLDRNTSTGVEKDKKEEKPCEFSTSDIINV